MNDTTRFRPADFTAHLFDLDGVITPTAEVHMRAWARMFGEFLTSRGITEPYTEERRALARTKMNEINNKEDIG